MISNPAAELVSFLNNCRYDEVFHIPPSQGDGFIKKIDLLDGLYIHIWDCMFKEKITIPAENIDNSSIADYSLIYYSSPEAFGLQNPHDPEIKIDKLWNTIFMSGRSDTDFIINPAIPVKCIYIGFTKTWTNSQDGITSDFIKNKSGHLPDFSKPVFFFETSGNLEKKMIDEIYSQTEYSQSHLLFLKARAITLISEFISNVSERNFSSIPSYAHSYEINKIEQKLTASISQDLPSVRDLAREFCLSESTLKREFKKTYGLSISQYYMQKKMKYAYKLITEKNGNVSEIACMMGYEKVSCFIAMFKRHNGVSPGALLKSIPTEQISKP